MSSHKMKEEHRSNRWSMLRRDHDGQADPSSPKKDPTKELSSSSNAANTNSSAGVGSTDSYNNQYKSVADVVVAASVAAAGGAAPAASSEAFNTNSESTETGEDNTKIKKLVRKFFSKFKENEEEPLNPNKNLIFGTDLESSLKIASATISVTSADPDSFVEYGEIPIVVAKCGLFLKNNGLLVEGIFRVGGSSKRVRNLQYLFSQPPDFGRKLSWDGYNVHDAASLLRRFLNSMTEPVIPLELYEAFREPLRKRPQIIQYLTYRDPNNSMTSSTSNPTSISVTKNPPVNLDSITLDPSNNATTTNNPASTSIAAGANNTAVASSISTAAAASSTTTGSGTSSADKKKRRHRKKSHKRFVENIDNASKEYEQLVAQLPKQRKQLLLYILDLLDLFSQHSSENRMSTANLSAVFQPSVLAHPKHYLAPEEYILSQRVVEFLIEYSYKLLPRITGISKTPSFNKALDSTQGSTISAAAASSTPSRPQNLKHTSMTNVRASIPIITTTNPNSSNDPDKKNDTVMGSSVEPIPATASPNLPSLEKKDSLKVAQHNRKHSKSMSAADGSSADLLTNKNSSLNYYDESPVVANEDVVDNIASESGDNTD